MNKCEYSDCNRIAEVKIVCYSAAEILRCTEHAINYIKALQELLGTSAPIRHRQIHPNENHD